MPRGAEPSITQSRGGIKDFVSALPAGFTVPQENKTNIYFS